MESPWWVALTFLCMVGGFWMIWAEGPYIPRPSKAARWSQSWRKSWNDMHVRVARGEQKVDGSQPAIVPDGERLVMSFPVLLCENQTTNRRPAIGGRRFRKTVWSHRSKLLRAVIIAPVDAGTLVVTDRRVLFRGANKHKEFPIEELIVDSTSGTVDGIALFRRGYRKIAYFMGMRELWVQVHLGPEVSGRPGLYSVRHNFAGRNLAAVLRLLQSATPNELM